MEGSRVVESLDSLWFFTNIFSSSENQLLGSAGDEITKQDHVEVEEESSKEELSEPITPILQNQLNELPSAGEFSAETEPQMVKPKEERRRRRRRRGRKSGLNQRRKILGEFDLGIDLKEVSEETCQKMPPFNDNMAMKEHIKSWAYAVACTVR